MSPLKTLIALGAAGLTLSGCATGQKQGFGQVAGGVTGALIGSQFGSGSGKLAATALGAVVGTMIGGEMLQSEGTEAFVRAERPSPTAFDAWTQDALDLRWSYSSPERTTLDDFSGPDDENVA